MFVVATAALRPSMGIILGQGGVGGLVSSSGSSCFCRRATTTALTIMKQQQSRQPPQQRLRVLLNNQSKPSPTILLCSRSVSTTLSMALRRHPGILSSDRFRLQYHNSSSTYPSSPWMKKMILHSPHYRQQHLGAVSHFSSFFGGGGGGQRPPQPPRNRASRNWRFGCRVPAVWQDEICAGGTQVYKVGKFG
jgi:hypothetical protein